MLSAIIYFLVVFFVLLGVLSGAYLLMVFSRRLTQGKGRFVVVIPPQPSQVDVASLLCAARLRLGLMGDIACCEVIALDCGMPRESRRQCEALCRELDHTQLLKPEELLEKLKLYHEQCPMD